MRLWHQELLPFLPRQQLLGQHRECAALRGKGWGRPHTTVNYVFHYSPYKLYQYHLLVMQEMQKRGYQPDAKWFETDYRGKHHPVYEQLIPVTLETPIYPEHTKAYREECLENLAEKGIILEIA
ncbi:TIGR02328 family protein [Streptococcus ictaluri]|uniref:Pyrimidine dimer DNA glycosylase n=1 Tax=Streptococcus ictaluri 707-05 TaxID=764299 RepID=G5K6A0_9STRE|nr:TIGR02328 family protein [Streptococcus ictaluri]EHI68587.1 hypothetical protein STRIC_0587 [Streptococcus ictaluri 707-05]